jgi:hypothetical protein
MQKIKEKTQEKESPTIQSQHFITQYGNCYIKMSRVDYTKQLSFNEEGGAEPKF